MYETKKQLRAQRDHSARQADAIAGRNNDLAAKLEAAAAFLKSIDHEIVTKGTTWDSTGVTETIYRIQPLGDWDIDAIQFVRRSDMKEIKKEAAERARRDTLRTVIKALSLTDYEEAPAPAIPNAAQVYRNAHSLAAQAVRTGAVYLDNGGSYGAAQNFPNPHAGTDRLWADLQTALEVRAEQAATAARAETERKVAGLVPAAKKPAAKRPAARKTGGKR